MISNLAPFISIIVASLATLITALITWLLARLRQNRQEERIRLNLEQRELELEKQRNNLEKQQQTLMWQIEATALAKEDPQLAIVTAYQGIETAIQRNLQYSKEMLEGLDKQRFSTFYDSNLLEDLIGTEGAEIIKNMQDLRNRVIHGEAKQEELSVEKATEYVQKAIFLSRTISSYNHNREKVHE